MKKLFYSILSVILFTVAGILPVAGTEPAAVTEKGYSSVVMMPSGGFNGMLFSKKGVLELSAKGKLVKLSVFDKAGKVAAELSADAAFVRGKNIPVTVIMERILEVAQGKDGFRVVLCINGNRIVEKDCNTLKMNMGKIAPAAGKNIVFSEYSHAMKADGLRRTAGITFNTKWQPDSKKCFLIETDDIIMAFRKGSGRGNPFAGAFNKNTGSMLLVDGGLDWVVQYSDADGNCFAAGPDFFNYDEVQINSGNGKYQLQVNWFNNDFKVVQNISITGGRIETDLKVDCTGNTAILKKIAFPRWCLPKMPGRDKAVLPIFSGIESPNPTAGLLQSAVWPNGHSSMQMAALYNDAGNGIYLAFEDPTGTIKEQRFIGAGGIFDAQWIMDAAQGKKSIAVPGKGVLELYKGDWYEAGQLYKKFARTAPWWIEEIPRRDTPEWFRKNPLWIQGVVMRDHTAETFRYLQEYFEVPTAFVAGLLENTNGRWRFGPNFQIRDLVKNSLKDVRASGVRVGPYFNARLCYAGDEADKENNFSKVFKNYAVLDENGQLRTGNYGATGLHAVMCPACPQWQEHLYNNIAKIAAGGVDYIYHDQLPCSTPFSCWNNKHGHALNDPSSWLAGGHWQTYAKVKGELSKRYPDLAHTGEDASDAFLKCIDGFMVWRFGRSGHVPLFQSVYAPRIQFVGRGCDGHNIAGSYESFFPKYAEQLIFGEQIGWMTIDTIRYPSPRRAYLKKLALLRYAIADFMNSAEMQKPLRFNGKNETMKTMWGVDDINMNTTDKILHSVWKHTDGRELIMFINTANEVQSVRPLYDTAGKKVFVTGETFSAPQEISSIPEKITLQPYAAEFYLTGFNSSDPMIGDVQNAMIKGKDAMNSDRGLLIQLKQNFATDHMLNALRQDLQARDASWMVLATRNVTNNLGYHTNPRRNMYGNWIAAKDGAVIYYGQVYFGDDPATVDCTLATDMQGVKVQLIDITEDSPDFLLAEFSPEAGKWFDFRKYTVPLKRKVTGRRRVIFRVSGGECNFKSWRVHPGKN